MTTTSVQPGYIPLIQKPFCCSVTSLAMILYRRGFGLFDQEELAQAFEIRVPEEIRALFYKELSLRTEGEEGLETVRSAGIANRFFQDRDLPLHARSVLASEIDDLGEFIQAELQAGHDLWIEYHSDEIHGEAGLSHDSVVEQITSDSSGTTVTIVDPFDGHRTRTLIPIEQLERAVSTKFGREMGS